MVIEKYSADIVVLRKKKRYDVSTESIRGHPIQNYKVSPNLYSSNYDANMWSYGNPYGM